VAKPLSGGETVSAPRSSCFERFSAIRLELGLASLDCPFLPAEV
jgi:hypothetical protein